MILLEDVVVRRGSRTVIDGVHLTIEPGTVTGVTGPNGAGKSTLIDVIAGVLPLARGRATIDGEPLATLGARERARRVGVLSQRADTPFAFSVREVVAMGRHPHGDGPSGEHEAVARALASVDLTHLADASVERLSGGEQKRVQIARFLAQLSLGETGQVALLDEPTESLDLRHQRRVMGIAVDLARRGLAVVVVQHDVGLLARYADRVVVVNAGQVVAAGAPERALTPEVLRDVFGVDAALGPSPWADDPSWLFVRP